MRPWQLRALVMTVVYGLAETLYVIVRGNSPDLATLWTALGLAVVLLVGIGWSGTEVILDRRPPEWTWFGVSLLAGPAAGLLSWILLAAFVDSSGPADLGPAIFQRGAFTALLVLASVGVGSRLGWLSLRRRGGGDADPMMDRSTSDPDAMWTAADARLRRTRSEGRGAGQERPTLAPETADRVAALRERRRAERAAAAGEDTGATMTTGAGETSAAGSGDRATPPSEARPAGRRRAHEVAPPRRSRHSRADDETGDDTTTAPSRSSSGEAPQVAVLPEVSGSYGAGDASSGGEEQPDPASSWRAAAHGRRGIRRPE